jgi:hypothetical protein
MLLAERLLIYEWPARPTEEKKEQIGSASTGTMAMNAKVITIPAGLGFKELALEREPRTRRLLYKPVPLERLIAANRLAIRGTMFEEEDLAAWLIAEWYLVHRSGGGEKDPVAEQILTEFAALRASGIPAPDPGGGQVH